MRTRVHMRVSYEDTRLLRLVEGSGLFDDGVGDRAKLEGQDRDADQDRPCNDLWRGRRFEIRCFVTRCVCL